MLRFIFFCMAFMALSFLAVPAYVGISQEHQKLIQTAALETSPEVEEASLTFEEIYALADESLMNDPSALNAIMPAAGDGEAPIDKFSSGFSGREDSALSDELLDQTLVE